MGIEMWEGFLFVKDVDLSPFVLGSSSNFVGWGYYAGHPLNVKVASVDKMRAPYSGKQKKSYNTRYKSVGFYIFLAT